MGLRLEQIEARSNKGRGTFFNKWVFNRHRSHKWEKKIRNRFLRRVSIDKMVPTKMRKGWEY